MLRSRTRSSTAERRFRVEAELLGRLRHPGVAQVYEAGVEVQEHLGHQQLMPWFAMELVEEARTLSEWQAAERGCTPEEVRDEIAQGMALRKMPTDADVAEAAVFFASDRSSMITGQRLLVNAGEFYDT